MASAWLCTDSIPRIWSLGSAGSVWRTRVRLSKSFFRLRAFSVFGNSPSIRRVSSSSWLVFVIWASRMDLKEWNFQRQKSVNSFVKKIKFLIENFQIWNLKLKDIKINNNFLWLGELTSSQNVCPGTGISEIIQILVWPFLWFSFQKILEKREYRHEIFLQFKFSM